MWPPSTWGPVTRVRRNMLNFAEDPSKKRALQKIFCAHGNTHISTIYKSVNELTDLGLWINAFFEK